MDPAANNDFVEFLNCIRDKSRLREEIKELYKGQAQGAFWSTLQNSTFPMDRLSQHSPLEQLVNEFLGLCPGLGRAQVRSAFFALYKANSGSSILREVLVRLGEEESGELPDANEGEKNERRDGPWPGERKHPKVVHAERIARRLAEKGRVTNLGICHNDPQEERRCEVQPHAVGLAQAVERFDSEAADYLEIIHTVDTIHGMATTYFRYGTAFNKFLLNAPIHKLRHLLTCPEDAFAPPRKNTRRYQERFAQIAAHVQQKLSRVIPDAWSEDVVSFLEQLRDFLCEQRLGKYASRPYDLSDNLALIEVGACEFKSKLLNGIQVYAKKVSSDMGAAVSGLSDPFSEDQTEPGPAGKEGTDAITRQSEAGEK